MLIRKCLFCITIAGAFFCGWEYCPGDESSALQGLELELGQTPAIKDARLVIAREQEVTAELMKIVRQSQDAAEVDSAIRLLGEFRATEATSVLLENVVRKSQGRSTVSRLAKFPAAQSLVQIGSSIYPEIYARLGRDISLAELYLLAFVAHSIDGRDVAAFRIKQTLEDAALTHTQKSNLKILHDLLTQTDFGNPATWPK